MLIVGMFESCLSRQICAIGLSILSSFDLRVNRLLYRAPLELSQQMRHVFLNKRLDGVSRGLCLSRDYFEVSKYAAPDSRIVSTCSDHDVEEFAALQ
jgi:hypothetical protein